jgi:UDP-N-acetylglucosamine 2-epimerase (non-hydrolysing)
MIAAAMGAKRTIAAVVGARPNFVKTAPVVAELSRRSDRFDHVLVHTGQHYDDAMSASFLEELAMGAPDCTLGVGSGSHAQQLARVIERIEPVLLEIAPDLVLVAGDVNSTLGAALAATGLRIPVAHIEAGLRSFDRTMPEETNRVLVDAVADLRFTHSPEARGNLEREGARVETIHAVGNTMIDTLVAMRSRIDAVDAPAAHGLPHGGYLVVTLHRPALVDGPLLGEALGALASVAREMPVVFPAHPRTEKALAATGTAPASENLRVLEPLGYVEFLSLLAGAAGVLTDSGGIQEETTFLGVPCFTLRDNTERPVTCELGTNTLLGLDPSRIPELPGLIEAPAVRPAQVPEGWDGAAAVRLVDVLERKLGAPPG